MPRNRASGGVARVSDLPLRHDDDNDACVVALDKVHAFLQGELEEADADLVRLHLDACEKCLNDYDVEQVITQLVRRCNPPAPASSQLRMRIVKMTLTMHEPPTQR